MRKIKIKNKKGVTLVELLVAISILSILSLGFFKFLSGIIKFNSKNEKDIQCLNIAQSVGEEIRDNIKNNSITLDEYKWIEFKNQNFIEEDFSPQYVDEYEVKEIFNEYIIQEVDDENLNNKKMFQIKILLYRQKKYLNSNEFLYTIDINVRNNKFTNKVVKLRYQVFR